MVTQIATVTFRYSHTIGRNEESGTGFRCPVDVARGKDDRLYVVNRSFEYRPERRRVTICTVEEDYIGEIGTGVTQRDYEESSTDGSFVWPTSIALDSEENLYIADQWLNRISIFTRDGDWIGKWGVCGAGEGQINGPSGLAFDPQDNLYLVDSKNQRVQKFTRDGKLLLQWGRQGQGEGEFNFPWGIDIDRDGNVYVADWRNDRVQKFSSDGQFLMQIGSSGQGDGQFNRPAGVAVDNDGVIYVTDWQNNRVQVFDREGEFITKLTGDATVSKWGSEKLDANPDMWKEREVAQELERERNFFGPAGVEVDEQGRLFVADSARCRVQVYRKIAPYFLGKYDNGRL